MAKACSPDLNHITSICEWMVREVFINRHQFKTLDTLCETILSICSDIISRPLKTFASNIPYQTKVIAKMVELHTSMSFFLTLMIYVLS